MITHEQLYTHFLAYQDEACYDHAPLLIAYA